MYINIVNTEFVLFPIYCVYLLADSVYIFLMLMNFPMKITSITFINATDCRSVWKCSPAQMTQGLTPAGIQKEGFISHLLEQNNLVASNMSATFWLA